MARLCALALALARVALVCVGRSRAVGGAAGSCAAARPTRTCAACLPPAVPYTLHHQLLSRQNGDAMAWERSPRRGRTPRDRTMDFHCHGMENITPAENITPHAHAHAHASWPDHVTASRLGNERPLRLVNQPSSVCVN